MSRSVHGIELTAAGRAFLDHARLALTQAEAAAEAARRAAQPVKPTFAMGFQTGQEVDWLPRATTILRDELLNIEIRVSSDHSTMLADDLQRGRLDIAFLRREQKPDLEYQLVAKEPLVVILPSDHPLASREAIDPHDLVGETFIGISSVPRVLRTVIDDYLKRCGIEIVPHLEIDNFAMAVSLAARPDVKRALLDFGPVNFIDITASDELLSLIKELRSRGITLAFARVRDVVRDDMRLAGIEATVGPSNFHERITDGVRDWLQ